jgi:preprotein translocase subunit SecF
VKALLVVVVLLLVGIAGLGFYQGWFHLSTNSTDQKSSTTITVDKDKIQKDEQTVKDKVQGIGQEAKEKTGEQPDNVKEEERHP